MVREWIKNYKQWIFLISSWFCLLLFLMTYINGLWQFYDKIVYEFLMSLRYPMIIWFMKILTWLGSFWTIIVICLILFIINFQSLFTVSIHVVIMMIINFIIKQIIARPRPNILPLIQEMGFSFPSFHAMVSMTIYGLIAYQLWKRSRFLAILVGILPILIGITRIYLGVHYLSDVVAGWLISLCYLSILYFIHKKPSVS